MKTIYKYALDFDSVQDLELPTGAQILDVNEQDGRIMIWAMVEPDAPLQVIKIWIQGTGQPFNPDAKRYLGTVHPGAFVWHIFTNYGY